MQQKGRQSRGRFLGRLLNIRNLGKVNVALVVLLCVSLLALFFSYRSYTSASERADAMEKELTSAKAELVRARKKASNLDELKAKLSDIKTQIKNEGVDFPTEPECLRMSTSLSQLAKENNVELVDYASTRTTGKLGESKHLVFKAQLTAKGKPLDLASFLKEITDFPTMVIQNLSFQRGKKGWTMNVGMTMYLGPKPGGQEE